MKLLDTKLYRKDPLSPLLNKNHRDIEYKGHISRNKSEKTSSKDPNSSILRSFQNNSSNNIIFKKNTSIFSENFLYDMRKTNFTMNTISQDDVYNQDKIMDGKYQKKNAQKKIVTFLNNQNFIQIIPVESYKKYYKIDLVENDINKDIDKIKTLMAENKSKKNYTHEKLGKLAKKEKSNVKNIGNDKRSMSANSKITNLGKGNSFKQNTDKACKCLIF
jgi:hypothetical protein